MPGKPAIVCPSSSAGPALSHRAQKANNEKTDLARKYPEIVSELATEFDA
jgi:hypothetical protein